MPTTSTRHCKPQGCRQCLENSLSCRKIKSLAEICEFIRVFDEVTARAAWQAAALRGAPAIAQLRRNEVCFFSAWDFHLAPTGEWQLIEFNDNGSGFILAAIINALCYEAAGLEQEKRIAAPDQVAAFKRRIGDLVEGEAVAFFKKYPDDLFLVLDDAESLQRVKFFQELQLLNDLFCQRGWQSEIAGPSELQWNGRTLLCTGRAVSFIVNRSTDFFWQSKVFSALCTAYQAGQVYIAPQLVRALKTRSQNQIRDQRNGHQPRHSERQGFRFVIAAWNERQAKRGQEHQAVNHHQISGAVSRLA